MGERSDQISDQFDASDKDQRMAAGPSQGANAAEDSDDTAEIRAGIEQTRSDMSETIEAIQDRLNPQHIKEQVQEQVREQFQEAKAAVREATIGKVEAMIDNAGDTINEARYGLMETIRQNPIPAAMVGLGLGWLFMNRRSAPHSYGRYSRQSRYYQGGQPYYRGQRDYGRAGYAYGSDQRDYGRAGYSYDSDQRHYDRGIVEQGRSVVGHTLHRAQETAGNVVDQAQQTVGNVVNQAQETAGSVVDQAQQTASSIADQAQETASYIADQAQYQAERLEDRFQQTLYENPLAVGAVALALGAAVGFTLPQTERENELLGEARDNLVDRAQEAAQETLQKVQRVAGEVIDEAQTTARESAREQGLTGQQRERGT